MHSGVHLPTTHSPARCLRWGPGRGRLATDRLQVAVGMVEAVYRLRTPPGSPRGSGCRGWWQHEPARPISTPVLDLWVGPGNSERPITQVVVVVMMVMVMYQVVDRQTTV